MTDQSFHEARERLRTRAKSVVANELRRGRLVRPELCERCGRPGPPAKDGRATIHAHHHDHRKPLEIEWLCVTCHRRETPVNPREGETHPCAKLTAAQVVEIRNSDLPKLTLAAMYGVGRPMISTIKSRKWWKSVP